jgi:hypothetical protein
MITTYHITHYATKARAANGRFIVTSHITRLGSQQAAFNQLLTIMYENKKESLQCMK